jgi:carbon-monoxide dehydrogenase large subunit
MLHAAVHRSPHAHARIRRVDTRRARAHPGVRLAVTGRDLGREIGSLPDAKPADKLAAKPQAVPRPLLALDTVNYVGEGVAVVIATDRYAAEDAAELVDVEYEPLPAVTSPEAAMQSGHPKVHEHLRDNVGYYMLARGGDLGKAFQKADRVLQYTLVNQRVAPASMEPRGVVASYDPGDLMLTVWLSTQAPFAARTELADLLRVPENRVRVIAPDVGGGFGCKVSLYPEEVVVAWSAMKLGTPVKWIETRRENFHTTTHGRGQKHQVEVAVKEDGKLLAVKTKVIADVGAYNTWLTAYVPELTLEMLPGCYQLEAYRAELFCVLTNKVPTDAYRGAGRPEATFLIERLIELVARDLGLDPVEVRLRNFVPKERFPFTTLTGLTYDSGDYEKALKKALATAEYSRWRRVQRQARREGRYIGIGLSSYVEICGFGPDTFQTAMVQVTRSGTVTVYSGASPHGQGHESPLAQIVADELGVRLEDVIVRSGDTATLPWGLLTAGSRGASLSGSAVLLASRRVREKMAKVAAHALAVEPDDLRFEDSEVRPAKSGTRGLAFRAVAERAYKPGKLPKGFEPSLLGYAAFVPGNYTFPFGTHVAVIEVDVESGKVTILRYVAVDDVGTELNPLVVDGQVHGGVLQGLAQALYESVTYGADGQLLTTTFTDYLMPTAVEAPAMEPHRTCTPSPANPLGTKGIGEAGAIAATPAIVNAVEDALAPFRVRIVEMPLSPEVVLHHIRNASVGRRLVRTRAEQTSTWTSKSPTT